MDLNDLIEHVSDCPMCGTETEIAFLREVQAAMMAAAVLCDRGVGNVDVAATLRRLAGEANGQT